MSTPQSGETPWYNTEQPRPAPGYGQPPMPPQPPVPVPYQHGGQWPYQPGSPYPVRQVVAPRSMPLAVLASFVIPGLGSIINGKVGKGLLILGCYFVACISCLILIGFVLAPAVWIWGMIAAANDVRAWNRQHGIIS